MAAPEEPQMKRQPPRDGPQAAGSTNTIAGRDPANKPKKFRIFGTDTTTGKKVTILSATDAATGSTVTGVDEKSGLQVTLKVAGRDPAN
jgi:uncharacterized NAD-dependent epimerase/dehydratase family protein